MTRRPDRDRGRCPSCHTFAPLDYDRLAGEQRCLDCRADGAGVRSEPAPADGGERA